MIDIIDIIDSSNFITIYIHARKITNKTIMPRSKNRFEYIMIDSTNIIKRAYKNQNCARGCENSINRSVNEVFEFVNLDNKTSIVP